MATVFRRTLTTGFCLFLLGSLGPGCAPADDESTSDDSGSSESDIVSCDAQGAVFLRHHAAFNLGHVGFAFFNCANNKWYYGAVENPSGKTPIAPGRPNGAFFRKAQNFNTVLNDMRGFGYVEYKISNGAFINTDPDNAIRVGSRLKKRGYDVFGNNCLDAVFEALDAYFIGQISMGDPSFALSPNLWYAELPSARWSGGFAL